MNTKTDREEQLVLELLDAVGKKSDLNQRHLASQMGVALGLANSYLKRCIRKGWVKISAVPANRYLYYLTPKGFAEKSRLTAKYLAHSLEFYRKAGESCLRAYAHCRGQGWRRAVLCGCSDLAEIAVLRAQEMDISVVGIYDPRSDSERLVGKQVWRSFNDVPEFDVCILTDLNTPAHLLNHLRDIVDHDKIFVPDILQFK